VAVQIAHLAGGGGYDAPATDAALSVFVKVIERKDPRMKNVYFDVCGVDIPRTWEKNADLVVQRNRQIGTNRLLYGSDAATADNRPKGALKRWHSLPLAQEEFCEIETMSLPTSVTGSRLRSRDAEQPSNNWQQSRWRLLEP
jgi:predicted TIM-barrel fold metal-dependent hydrolase